MRPGHLPRLTLAVLAAAGSFALGGCDRGASAGEEDGTIPVAVAAAEDSAGAFQPAEPEPLPERIYFDLTRYDWYARGEPLVYSDVPYDVGRDLLAAPLSAMRKLGEYQGVDVYGSNGSASDSAVYVPVFPGYWQPFVRADAATAVGG